MREYLVQRCFSVNLCTRIRLRFMFLEKWKKDKFQPPKVSAYSLYLKVKKGFNVKKKSGVTELVYEIN